MKDNIDVDQAMRLHRQYITDPIRQAVIAEMTRILDESPVGGIPDRVVYLTNMLSEYTKEVYGAGMKVKTEGL